MSPTPSRRSASPGANDNCTGVATLLEIGRTLARLIRDGALPKPRRTIRFVWGNEISGSTAFMNKHPELQDKLLAALNFDMTGANMKTTDCYLRMKMTPDGRPSYLNDLIANLLQFVDQAEIRTTQGGQRPLQLSACARWPDHLGQRPFRLPGGRDPDDAVQLLAGQFLSQQRGPDRPCRSDRVETGRGSRPRRPSISRPMRASPKPATWPGRPRLRREWIAEVARQSVRLLGTDPAKDSRRNKAAQNKVTGAFGRAKGGVESVRTLAASPDVETMVRMLTAGLEANRVIAAKRLEAVYRQKCTALGLKPTPLALTEKEREYARLFPKRKFKVYSVEAQKHNQAARSAQPSAETQPQSQPAIRAQAVVAAGTPEPPILSRFASISTSYFIDGRRSILDIYNAVRAECGNLQVGSQESKYAYVLGLEYPDVDLEAVATAIRNLEKEGVLEIITKPPSKADRDKE